MNAQIRQWFGTEGWFVQLLGGCFRQDRDYPTFYHLAVMTIYKRCYSQEPWLLKTTLSGNFKKSEINTYTWNFGMYDIPSERQEFNLYGSIKIV